MTSVAKTRRSGARLASPGIRPPPRGTGEHSVLAAAVLALWVSANALQPAGHVVVSPSACGTGPSMILSAQVMPSAAKLPCIAARPSGWTAGAADISNGRVLFWLDSDQAGPRAVTMTLTPACGTSGAIRVPSDQPGAARFERPLSLQPRFTLVRMYTFPGGCITYQFSFIPGAAPSLAIPIDTAIAFEPWTVLAGHVQRKEDLALCGRGAPCPG